MVVRKPTLDNLATNPPSQPTNLPPYPISPTEGRPPALLPSDTAQEAAQPPKRLGSPAYHPTALETAQRLQESADSGKTIALPESESESENEWDSDGFEEIEAEDDEPSKQDIPAPLKVAHRPLSTSPKPPTYDLPATLRPGPPGGAIPKQSYESLRPTPPPVEPASFGASSTTSSQEIPLQSHNPYLRYNNTGQSSVYSGDGQSQVGSVGATSTNPFVADPNAVELPSHKTPVEEVSKMSLNGAIPHEPSAPPPLPPISTATVPTGDNPDLPRRESSPWNPEMDISSLDAFSSRNHRLEPTQEDEGPLHRTWQEQQDWERKERERREMELAAAHERAKKKQEEQSAIDEWQRGEAAFAAQAQQSVHQQSLMGEDVPPPLPPRTSTEEQAPARPPRPSVETSGQQNVARPEVETPGTRSQRQRMEHYQIKHVRWFDARKQGIRPVPILTQNANGPCPLLALVNALVLSTPAGEETALIETLRTREQVSLGLLLDAVFDELMSGRRGDAAQQLPDVGDLYAFLVTLHSGMNVNPRFVKAASADAALVSRSQAGGFDDTREMRLYSTFNIPLIHGWLPPSESRAFAAFDRIAKTYEDAQNVQFHEEELEAKLQSQGLTNEEQNMFQDLQSIKDFLRTWPTQLTDYGLGIMAQNLKPGQIAILFRNDHFSTLYKEPRSGRIFTLVTDSGYGRHEEIVWETLVDVNGQGSELFSGDFRPVGNMSEARAGASQGQQRPIRSLLDVDDDQGRTTVGNNRQNQQSAPRPAATSSQPSATQEPAAVSTEQEDHDLALAMQLQEEEEDRHRREVEERRRRENELSEQYLSNQTTARPARQEIRPLIPPRRTRNNNGGPTGAAAASNEDAPPPTYEQAAAGRPYNPPQGHPASTHLQGQGPPTLGGNQSAFAPVNGGRRRFSNQPQLAPSRIGENRRASGSQLGQGHAATSDERDKCIIM